MRYQTVVIGGGTTGVCAAVAAARGGAKVLLVEVNGFLGGNAANGLAWLGFHSLDGRRMVGGIPAEIIERLRALGGATESRPDPICGSCTGVEPGMLKIVLHRMVCECGVDVRLHSMFSSVRKLPDGWEVHLHEKQGMVMVEADTLIDCTDTGDVAASAGVPMQFGRDKDGKAQISSTVIRVNGIDMDAFCGYFRENPDQLRPFPLTVQQQNMLIDGMRHAPIFVMGAFPKLIAKALADGVDYPRDRLIGTGNALTGELLLVASRVENVNPNDTENYTRAEMEGAEQTIGIMELLRGYLPGCENAHLMAVGHSIGVRETRHMQGRYRLVGEDLISARDFEDTIAHGAYHLDVHSPDHKGLESQMPKPYSVPFGICQPVGIDRLLVAGRSVSADQAAESSIRVIPILGAIGQACGTAAALAQAYGGSTDAVEIQQLRTTLEAAGAVI